MPGTLGEREGERESQRINRGKGRADSLLFKESGIKILNLHTLFIERISRLMENLILEGFIRMFGEFLRDFGEIGSLCDD